MTTQHSIELWMTLALALYIGAFVIARRAWTVHVVLALSGFVADMYATYLMAMVSRGGLGNFLNIPLSIQVHTLLALFAVGMFLIQATLGYKTWRSKEMWRYELYRRRHITFAKWVFLPVWFLAYGSGLLLFL